MEPINYNEISEHNNREVELLYKGLSELNDGVRRLIVGAVNLRYMRGEISRFTSNSNIKLPPYIGKC